jgi:hypothetical protein
MKLFQHSLNGKAKDCYLDQTDVVMANWSEAEDKFINHLYPQSNVHDANTSIVLFSQRAVESLYGA